MSRRGVLALAARATRAILACDAPLAASAVRALSAGVHTGLFSQQRASAAISSGGFQASSLRTFASKVAESDDEDSEW